MASPSPIFFYLVPPVLLDSQNSREAVPRLIPSLLLVVSIMNTIASFLVLLLASSRSSQAFSSPRRSSSLSMSTTNVIAGATGYIGKSVVRESVRQGYNTVALVRDKTKVESPEGKALYGTFFEGATIVECDVTDPKQVEQASYLFSVVYCIVLY